MNIKKSIYILILLLLMMHYPVKSESRLDSLQNAVKSNNGIEKADAMILLSYEQYPIDARLSLATAKKSAAFSTLIGYQKGIVESHNNIAFAFMKLNKIDSAITYFKKAIEIAEKKNDYELLAKAVNNLGNTYFSMEMYESAERLYHRAYLIRKNLDDLELTYKSILNLALANVNLKRFNKANELYIELHKIALILKDTSKIIDSYDYLASINTRIAKYSDALSYYFQLLKIFEDDKQTNSESDVYASIANIYIELKEYQKAEKFLNRAYNSIENSSDLQKAWRYLSLLGIVFYEQKHFEKSLDYYKRALNIVDKIDDLDGKASLLNNIGLVYKNLGKHNEAIDYCNKSMMIWEKMGEDLKTYYPITSIAETYDKLGNYYQASLYFKQGLEIALKNNKKNLISQSYEFLSGVLAKMGNYKESLHYQILYSALKDTLLSIESAKKMAELNVKYESEKKEQENRALQKANRMQLTFFLVISGLILIILIIIYARYRTKQKANRLLTEKNQQIEQQKENLEFMYGELRHKEEILTEANATKDKFFSIIAHDLKNPLHAITLSSDLLLSKFKFMDGEQLVKLIANINKAGNHLAVLLENLLQWARSQSGRIEFHPTIINLEFIAHNLVSTFQEVATKKNIELTSTIDNSSLVYGDPNMIETVMRNLTSNALKFTPPNGYVKLYANSVGEEVIVTVEDNGIGISEEDMKKLFRIDIHYTTIGTSKEKGTGLGLILCKEFIDKNNGRIWVESTEKVGSKFNFSLPEKKI